MNDLLGILAILLPCLSIACGFFVKARRADGLDRRKLLVGGTVTLLCGVLASLAAWGLVAAGPPGQ